MMVQREIWLLLDSRGVGGIETHVLNLAIALHQQNKHVRIVFLENFGPHPLALAAQEEGIAIIKLSGGVLSLFREIGHRRPALIHTHGYKAGIFGRVIARMAGIPVVSTYHAGEPGQGRVHFYNIVDRLSACLASVIAVSEAIARALPVPSKLINNFVVLPKQLNFSNNKNIAFVGRLSEEKGPDLFLKLAAYCPDLSFHLYGDGPMRSSLADAASANVMFHGVVDSMADEWKGVGLLCLSSRYEGLPLVVLEAMAQGVAVAAFDVGAVAKLIRHGDNGFIAASQDLESLRDHIKYWQCLSKAQRLMMARRAQCLIFNEYSPQAVLPEILDVYRRASDGDVV